MSGLPFRTRFAAALLLVLAALASGCVYLRLLEFKRQLADFDRNFAVDSAGDLKIECRDPVLHGDDLRWLGAFPETITTSPTGDKIEQWHVRWVKDCPPGIKETVTYDLILDASLKDDHLTNIIIAERYFAFFSKELFVDLLRSASSAKVNRSDKEAEIKSRGAEKELKAFLPKFKNIREMLGEPSTQSTDKDELTFVYQYRAVTQETGAKPIVATFTFDEASGTLKEFLCKLPKGTIRFKLDGKSKGKKPNTP